MKGKKYVIAAVLTALCILLDMIGRQLGLLWRLPLWLDCFGTVIAAFVLGPVSGAVVGLAANVIAGIFGMSHQLYGITGVAVGLIVGFAARKKRFETLFNTMAVCTLVAVVSVAISTPLNFILRDGMTSNRWGDGVISVLEEGRLPTVLACILGQLYLEFLDKVLTLVCLFAGIHLWRKIQAALDRRRELRQAAQRAAALGLAVILFLSLGLGLLPDTAQAADTGRTDFYSYVQTIYNASNGLPSGEATCVLQTRDGFLWIGTYAGLYRYDGTEFTAMTEYSSVKNVKSLYEDEEGRLWIGTNDKGLSVVINQNVANVLDMKSGLSANSVRGIVRSADGYYYVGTTDTMQVLSLTDGLRIECTIQDVAYTPSLAADQRGNVAAVSARGELYLLRDKQVILTKTLEESAGIYTCCMFDDSGLLYAGTSGNEARVYRISGDELLDVTTYTFENLKQVNSLYRTDTGLLFACGDNGVGCFDATSAYSWLFLPGFDNSIDSMTMDYQGNFWFSSSRFGLLRLSRGAFTDIYGANAMEKSVVNGVTMWQGFLCVATDRGLDMADPETDAQVTNPLTALLAGVRLRCIFCDSREHLWICTHGKGLYEVDPDWKVSVYDSTNGFCNWMRIVQEAEDGTIVGSGDLGLGYFRDGELIHIVPYEPYLGNSMVLSLEEAGNGLELVGTNGNGLVLLKDRSSVCRLTTEDGLSSEVVLRTLWSEHGQGWYIVTSNALCFMETDYSIRVLENFPYSNNYDLWTLGDGRLYVLGSAGVIVVDEDELLSGQENLVYDLLNARRGLSATLTPNSWNYLDKNGLLYLSSSAGVYGLNLKNYGSMQRSFRMQVASARVDGVLYPLERGMDFTIGQDTVRVDLSPLVLNYTLEDPYVSYQLVGYEPERTVVRWSELGDVSYTGLPSGEYTFVLSVLDQNKNSMEERSYTIIKELEFQDHWWFQLYLLLVGGLMVAWITWFIARTQIQRTLNFQRKELEFARQQVQMGNETILAIAKTVDAKDESTSQHSQRVSEYAVMIGRELGFTEKECENLRKAALLHDIGKIGIPDRILNKPGKLTDEEYIIMKSHVTHGAEILKDFTMVEHVVEGALYHHERYDGRGYVSGLKGEEIPIYGRIIGVADTFDAMTQNRVYRQGLGIDFVVEEIERCKGTQFDPRIADIMLRLVREGKIALPNRGEEVQIS